YRPRPKTETGLLVGAASRTICRTSVHQSGTILATNLHRWRLLLWGWNAVSLLAIRLVAWVHRRHSVPRIWLIAGVWSVACGHWSRPISHIHRLTIVHTWY